MLFRSSFLSAFVVNYVRSHRDRQNLRLRREPLIVDTPVETDSGASLYYQLDPHEDDYSSLYEEELVDFLRSYLSRVPRKSRQDQCDLLKLFDAVVEQVRKNGKYSVKELQAIFGVSPTAIHSWLGWLRHNIILALEEKGV